MDVGGCQWLAFMPSKHQGSSLVDVGLSVLAYHYQLKVGRLLAVKRLELKRLILHPAASSSQVSEKLQL